MNIIGLGYRSGTGKDTVADYIVEQFGFEKVPFAYNLKIAAWEAYGHLGVQPPNYYEGPHKEARRKETYGPMGWNIVQFWVHMNTLCVPEPRHWVDLTLKGMKPDKFYVIPDVRKEIEIEAIKELGGVVVHIDRDVPEKPEAEIDKLLIGKEHLFEYTIDNNEHFAYTAIQITGVIDDVFRINGTLEQ